MDLLFKILVLATLSLLGWQLYPVMVNLLILINAIQIETVTEDFATQMTQKAVFIWIISVGLGIVSLFIKRKWRYVLLLAPLIFPSLFTIIYSII